MVKLCCIPICPNSKNNRAGVPCFPFPSTDDVLRDKWIEFVAGSDNTGRFRWKSKHICVNHFHQLDLIEMGNDGAHQPRLQDGAVPHLYSPDEAENDKLVERDHVMVSSSVAGSDVTSGATVDLSAFCRICLKKTAGLVPFYSKLHNENLLDVIYTVTGLELDDEEFNLPKKICASCVGKIDLAFNIRKEFVQYETILRNMVKNSQLEAYFRCYDNHLDNPKGQNEDYIQDLMKDVKTELIIEPIEVMEEEHLYDEDLDIPEQSEENEVSIEGNTSDIKINVEMYADSEEEKEENPPKKMVYSWKELYKPKRARSRPKEYKIKEDLPEPELVPNTCYICHTVHDDADTLDSHIEQHVSLIPYPCTECSTNDYPVVLKSLITLNKHLQSHLYPYICDFCPLRYINRRSYISHMRSAHESSNTDGYTCDDCGRFFKQQRTFNVHMYKHKAVKEEKFKCEHCGKAFSSNALLTRHLRIHTGEKPYECKKCGKRFNHESIFQVHKRIHIGEKAHICTECGKRFIIATELRYHMAEHFPDDPQYRSQYTKKRPNYSSGDPVSSVPDIIRDHKSSRNVYSTERICDFENCTYSTKSIPNWHYHRSMHLRKYQCEICSKRYPTKQCLVNHIEKIHEGKVPEKNKPCPYCEKKFSNNQKLQVHVDIHENNRRYKCRFCEKAFVQQANLTAHERTHTGEKPFPCRACSSAFITSSARRKHEKTHPELDKTQRKKASDGVDTQTE